MDWGVLVDGVARAWPYLGPLLGTLIGFAFASWLESQRAARTYRWQRRDAQVARLRDASLPLVLSAWGYESAVNQMTWGLENETPQQKNERINSLLAESTKGINEARGRLALEVDAKPFIDKFHELYVAFKEYMSLTVEAAQGIVPVPLLATKKKVIALSEELQQMIRDKIAELERIN